ncbi:hypothetical protein BC567DRAFT_265382 [Phyllosticta citribraziliensis]
MAATGRIVEPVAGRYLTRSYVASLLKYRQAITRILPFLALPRELRDMICDEIFADEFPAAPWGRTGDCLAWGVSYCGDRGKVSWAADFPENLSTMMATCKQVQQEIVERMHSTLFFEVEMRPCESLDSLTWYGKEPYIDVSNIQRLAIELFLEPVCEMHFKKPSENCLIKEPFSILYSDSHTLSDATLCRSSESLSPTPFWDVQKHGIHGHSQLSPLLEARRVVSFPNRFNSGFGKAVTDFFVNVGRQNKVRILDLRFVLLLSSPCFGPDSGCVHTASGLSELTRAIALLHGIKDLNMRQTGNLGIVSCDGEPARTTIEEEILRLTSLVGCDRSGCNRNLNTICDCLHCFPALSDCPKDAFVEIQGEKDLDETFLQSDIDRVRLEKQRIELAREEDDLDQQGYQSFPNHRDDAFARLRGVGFQIGLPEHTDDDDDDCECADCHLAAGDWSALEPDGMQIRSSPRCVNGEHNTRHNNDLRHMGLLGWLFFIPR